MCQEQGGKGSTWQLTLASEKLYFLCWSVLILSSLSSAASDHLPEVPDHHADPDPGSPAVCRASVPHSRGITNTEPRLLSLRTMGVKLFAEQHIRWIFQWLCTLSSPQRDLVGIQHVLNSSEASLHQLTALLDCRGLNKVRSLHPNWHHSSTTRSTGE